MSDFERIPEPKDKLTEFQTRYNSKSKRAAHIIGTNLALYVCILLPFLLVGLLWTEAGLVVFGTHSIMDAIVTVAMFIIGEIMMTKVGADGGMIDPEYLDAKKEYQTILEKVKSVGTMFLAFFCEWQIDLELSQTRAKRLRSLRFTRKDWDTLKDMPYDTLVDKYGRKTAKKIEDLKKLEPIELNEAILLYDTRDPLARGGVPVSGDEYIYKKTHSVSMILTCVLSGLLTASIALTFASDASLAKIIYTFAKLIVLLFRMAQGYQIGAKAYNMIETRHLGAKSYYLRSYVRFVEDKTYLKLGDKYGDIECFIDTEDELGVLS